jgi:hypothetical protein
MTNGKRGIGSTAAFLLAAVTLGHGQAMGADQVVARLAQPAPIASYRGYSAWSTYDGKDKHYRLVVATAGHRGRRAPVRPRSLPFDVSLGIGPGGHVVAVYSRCPRHSNYGIGDAGLPEYTVSTGCTIYMLGLRSGDERPVLRPSRTIISRFQPAIRGNRVAYGAVIRTSRGRRPAVFVESIAGRHSRRRVRGGPLGAGNGAGAGVLDVAFDGRRVAYLWRNTGGCDPAGEDVEGLWLADLQGGARLVQHAGCLTDQAGQLFHPVFAGKDLAYVATHGFPKATVVRYRLSDGTFRAAPARAATFGLARSRNGWLTESAESLQKFGRSNIYRATLRFSRVTAG